MSRHRRYFAAVGVAAATSLALSACGTGGSTAKSSDGSSGGSTTITVMWASGELSRDQISAFETANPNIKVNFIEYDDARLNAMMTAGDPPDVVRGNPTANLFARGLVAPLDDYIAKSSIVKADDLVSANDVWKWDGKARGKGKTYGIIKDFSPDTTLWQNTALYTKAGVPPLSTTEPASWDDVLKKAEALKTAGVVKYPLGIEWQWGIAAIVAEMVEQQGKTVFNADFTKADYTSPEAVRALQWLVDYGKAGVGPTSLNPLADTQDAPSFIKQDMATTMDGYWFGGNLQSSDAAAIQATSQLVPAPTFGKRVDMIFGGVGGYIPAKSKHKDQAWKFLEYYTGGQPAVDRAKSGWGLPVLKSLWKDLPVDQPYQKQAYDVAQDELKYIGVGPDSPYVTFAQIDQAMNTEVQAAIQGKESTQDAAKKLTDQVNSFIQQGKDQLG